VTKNQPKMADLVANCPRCGSQSITHDVTAVNLVRKEHGWVKTFEAFATCRSCRRSTMFLIRERNDTHDTKAFEQMSPLDIEVALNRHFKVEGFISLKDQATVAPPEHVPENIAKVFREGATCLRVECWNAAGTMFRLCVDLATRPMLPEGDVPGLNS
jgi:transcription elongation factor Elf1